MAPSGLPALGVALPSALATGLVVPSEVSSRLRQQHLKGFVARPLRAREKSLGIGSGERYHQPAMVRNERAAITGGDQAKASGRRHPSELPQAANRGHSRAGDSGKDDPVVSEAHRHHDRAVAFSAHRHHDARRSDGEHCAPRKGPAKRARNFRFRDYVHKVRTTFASANTLHRLHDSLTTWGACCRAGL